MKADSNKGCLFLFHTFTHTYSCHDVLVPYIQRQLFHRLQGILEGQVRVMWFWDLSSEMFMFIFSQTDRERNESLEPLFNLLPESEKTCWVLQNFVMSRSHTLRSCTLHHCFQFISVHVLFTSQNIIFFFFNFMFFWTDKTKKGCERKDIVSLSYTVLEGGACCQQWLTVIISAHMSHTNDNIKRLWPKNIVWWFTEFIIHWAKLRSSWSLLNICTVLVAQLEKVSCCFCKCVCQMLTCWSRAFLLSLNHCSITKV